MKLKLPLLLIILVLLLSACRMPAATPEPEPVENIVATSVAATLAAKSPDQQPTAEPALPSATGPAPTQPPPTATFTPTLTATPTETPTPTPTATPTDVPGDPADELGSPDWRDNFNTKDNWNGFNDSQSHFELTDGAFLLTVKKANNFENWTISWPVIKDFYLEYRGAFGDECAGKDRYGMIFRAPNFNEGYLLGISCDGSYRLSAWDGEEYTVLRAWTKSDHLESGPGAFNRFGIKAKGETLTVYLNGEKVYSTTADLYTAKGKFGVFAAADKTAGFTAEVRRAAYWELP
jgi:hypothetical protein